MKRAALIALALALLLITWWALRIPRRLSAPAGVALSAPEPAALYRSKAKAGLAQPQAQGSGQAAPSQAAPAPAAQGQEAAAPSAVAPVKPAAAAKPADSLAELNSILEAGDDNDPRLDTDFNALTPQTKRLFRQRYSQAPAEQRNTRGTIVMLLGENLDSPEDWAFLRSVLSEPPCQSLEDCSHPAASKHQENGMRVTLAYPQMVALTQVEDRLKEARQPGGQGQGAAVQEAVQALRVAKASPVPAVSELAGELMARYGLGL
jgi:hypothetical protein